MAKPIFVTILPHLPDILPPALLPQARWAPWRSQPRADGTFAKLAWGDHGPLSSTSPRGWSTFATAHGWALGHYTRGRPPGFAGLGIRLTAGDGLIALDLDHCVDDHGHLSDLASDILCRLSGTYCERTPSLRGLRILATSTEPIRSRCTPGVELYSDRRWVSITGLHLPGRRGLLRDCTEELRELTARLFPQPGTDATPVPPNKTPPQHTSVARAERSGATSRTDEDLLALLLLSPQAPKYRRLLSGDWSAYPSQNEADLALMQALYYWGRDREQVDRLFRRSGLHRPGRKSEHYLARTLDMATRGRS